MSDIYSLSMVIVEVCAFVAYDISWSGSDHFLLKLVTGKVPFPEYTDQNVIVMVVKGGRPSRPRFSDTSGITLGVWEVAQECWNAEADKRPEVKTVLRRLGSLTNCGMCTGEVFKVEGFLTYKYHRWEKYTGITFPMVEAIVSDRIVHRDSTAPRHVPKVPRSHATTPSVMGDNQSSHDVTTLHPIDHGMHPRIGPSSTKTFRKSVFCLQQSHTIVGRQTPEARQVTAYN